MIPVSLPAQPFGVPGAVADARAFIASPQSPSKAADAELVKTALARWKLAAEAEGPQREQEDGDLEFDQGKQWDDDALKSRRASTVGNVITPARPCLVIDKIEPAISQTVNQMRTSRFAIEVHPKPGKANKATAEVMQGLIRNCEVTSHAQNARIDAGERAVKCGRGFYRVLKEYANDGDFDMDLVTKAIDNQSAVYFDPFAVDPMKRDAEWAFIVQDIAAGRFKRTWPRAALSNASGAELSSIGDQAPGWIRDGGDDEDGGAFRIAEYFDVTYTTKTLVMTASGWKGLTDAEDYPWDEPILMEREVQVRSIQWYKINAVEVLERELWEGRTIPIVPVIGKTYNVKGKKTYKGIINKAKDAQKSYNVHRSKQVEAVGLAPLAPWLVAEGQDEGYEQMWATANTTAYPTLKYRPVSLLGHPVAPPARNIVEPAIQAVTLAAHEAADDIKATTQTFDPSLGQNRGDLSGKAIERLQQQTTQGNSNYLDNFAQSIEYEGEIYVDMLRFVYDTPGRIANILGTDDEPRAVMLNAPFVPGPDGQPMPLPEMAGTGGGWGPATAGAPSQPPALPPKVELYNLKDGQYGVAVSIGKSFTTQSQEANAAMGDLITAAPQLAPVVSDLWIGEMDFPGAQAISDRLKRALPPELQDPKDGAEPVPAAAQQQLAQASQQLEAMQAEMTKLQQDAASKAQELEGRRMIAEMQEQSRQQIAAAKMANDAHIAEIRAQAAIATAGAKSEADKQKAELAAVLAQIKQALDLKHEATEHARDRAHEASMQFGSQAHTDGQTDRAQRHETRLHMTPAPPAPKDQGDGHA